MMGSMVNDVMACVLTPLMRAMMDNDVARVKALLDAGASPSRQNVSGQTALDMAAWRGNAEIFRVLVEAGADVSAENDGFTPLMMAAQLGHIDSVVEILKHMSVNSINHKGEEGRTALVLACSENQAYTPRALIEAGADATVCSEDGMTALFWASHWGNVKTIRMLIRAGADPVRQMDWGKRPTALHFAALNGNPLAVKELLLAGAQPSALDDWGRTPLHAATMKRHSGALAEIVSVLKAGRTDPKLFGSTETIAATLAIRDRSGKTAVHYAKETKHSPSVMILLQACAGETGNNAQGKRRAGHRLAGEVGPKDVLQPKNPAQEAYMARNLARGLAFCAQSWQWPAGETFDENVLRGTGTVIRVFRAKQGKRWHLELAKAMFGYAIKHGGGASCADSALMLRNSRVMPAGETTKDERHVAEFGCDLFGQHGSTRCTF